MTPPLVAEMVGLNGVIARTHFFAVKSNLRQAADRTPPVDSDAHLISCATLIFFALSESAACSFGKAKFSGELAQPA